MAATALDHSDRPQGPLRLVEGTELLGEFEGGGYQVRQHLIRRADGQVLQITHLLYLVASQLDGTRNLEQVAAAVTAAYGCEVDTDNVVFLVDRVLRPLGVVADGPDTTDDPSSSAAPAGDRSAHRGDQPLPRANPLLGLRLRVGVVPERLHRAVTSALRCLFVPTVVVTTLAGFVLLDAWIALEHRDQMFDGARQIMLEPQLLLLISVITWASMVFHEFGHAAALRYGGGTPGAMGAGVYIVWPVLYTDVTDSYRLDRRGRIRTDLGGVYFNVIFLVVASALFLTTGYEPLLVFIALSHLQVLQQFLPFVRLDGYYVVSDLVGVPNLFSYMTPVVMKCTRWRNARVRHMAEARLARLTPSARHLVTAWVLFTVPVLAINVLALLYFAPQLVGAGWGSARLQWQLFTAAIDQSAYFDAIYAVTGLILLATPIMGTGVILFMIGRRAMRAIARAPGRRPVTTGVGLTLVVLALGVYITTMWPRSFESALHRFEPQPVPEQTVPPAEPVADRPVPAPQAPQTSTPTPVPAENPTVAPAEPSSTAPAPPECSPDAASSADGRMLWMAELRCATAS